MAFNLRPIWYKTRVYDHHTYCPLLWDPLRDFNSHKKSILPSTCMTSHCRWLLKTWASFHLTLTFSCWVTSAPLHVSLTWGLVITQSCSIPKTLNSNISFSHLNPWPLCCLSVHQPLLCLLPYLISLVSVVQRLNPFVPFSESACLCSCSWIAEFCWRKSYKHRDLCLFKWDAMYTLCLADAHLYFSFRLESTPPESLLSSLI